jgi:tellurite resistance protein TehA-like permease
MAVKSTTFQVALIVILIVGLLLIIQSSWTLAQLNKTVADACNCSGVTDQDVNSLKMYAIITLLVGLGVVVYAILMFIMPTSEKRKEFQKRISARFASQNA